MSNCARVADVCTFVRNYTFFVLHLVPRLSFGETLATCKRRGLFLEVLVAITNRLNIFWVTVFLVIPAEIPDNDYLKYFKPDCTLKINTGNHMVRPPKVSCLICNLKRRLCILCYFNHELISDYSLTRIVPCHFWVIWGTGKPEWENIFKYDQNAGHGKFEKNRTLSKCPNAWGVSYSLDVTLLLDNFSWFQRVHQNLTCFHNIVQVSSHWYY